MFYEFDLTVPANTLAASPEELEIPLSAGTVVAVEVQFPAGCSGMVYVAIFRSGHQVWPGDPDEAISGENARIPWTEDYDLDDPPFGFVLRGWSPGATYDHKITFRFSLLDLTTAQGQRGLGGLLARMARVLIGAK